MGKVEKRRKFEDELQAAHTTTQISQLNSQDLNLQQAIQESSEALRNFEIKRVDWADCIIKSQWIPDGDKCSKLFFGHSNKCLRQQISNPSRMRKENILDGRTWLQ